MRCKEALQAVLDARYEGREPPAAALEALKRDECRELLERATKLDALLGLDEPHEPGPGFDTRFFAKLEEQKSRGRRGLFAGAFATLTVGAAAAAVLALTTFGTIAEGPIDGATDPEVALMRDLELLEAYDVVEKLDEVETFELLAALDPETLDQLIEEEIQ